MRQLSILAVGVAILAAPCLAWAESAKEILETAQKRQVERWEGVNAYTVDRSMMGQTVTTWFVRTEYQDDAGELQTFFVPMTATQIPSTRQKLSTLWSAQVSMPSDRPIGYAYLPSPMTTISYHQMNYG